MQEQYSFNAERAVIQMNSAKQCSKAIFSKKILSSTKVVHSATSIRTSQPSIRQCLAGGGSCQTELCNKKMKLLRPYSTRMHTLITRPSMPRT